MAKALGKGSESAVVEQLHFRTASKACMPQVTPKASNTRNVLVPICLNNLAPAEEKQGCQQEVLLTLATSLSGAEATRASVALTPSVPLSSML